MTTLRISLTLIQPPPHPNLATGIHHISEVMPHVLDHYGLSMEPEPESAPLEPTELNDLFDVMMACMEAVLAE